MPSVLSFRDTSDFVHLASANFASLEAEGEMYITNQRNSLDELKSNVFANVLMLQQLPWNLKERIVDSLVHSVWDFVILNANLGELQS